MAFTMPDYPMLSDEQINPMANAVQKALAGYKGGTEAKYQPKMLQADIFSKQFAPLAQIASNPLAMAMMGDKGAGIMQMISQLLQQSQGGASGSAGGGLMSGGQGGFTPSNQSQGSDQDTMSGGDQQSPNQDRESAGYDPSLPQKGKGLGAGYVDKSTAPYSERVHTPDTVYIDTNTGKTYTDPNPHTIAASSQSIKAIKRLIPQLNEIAKDSKEFTAPGSGFSTWASGMGNKASLYLPGGMLKNEDLKAIGLDPEKVSRRMEFDNKIISASKELMTAYPQLAESDQSMTMLKNMLQPLPGETTGYAKRVLHSVDVLNKRQEAMQQQMQPTEVINNSQSQNAPAQQTEQRQEEAPSGDIAIAQRFVAGVPKMKNDAEFKEAFKTYNPTVQKQILDLLAKQG